MAWDRDGGASLGGLGSVTKKRKRVLRGQNWKLSAERVRKGKRWEIGPVMLSLKE